MVLCYIVEDRNPVDATVIPQNSLSLISVQTTYLLCSGIFCNGIQNEVQSM
jgi:hypothetical protein